MVTKTSRSVPYKVTLTPELHERLREVAAQLGQAPATCAAMAIGQWVSQMHRNLGAADRATDAMVKQIGPEFSEQLKLMMNAPPSPDPGPGALGAGSGRSPGKRAVQAAKTEAGVPGRASLKKPSGSDR